MQPTSDTAALRLAGADNLLRACAGITAGSKVLFINEAAKGVDRSVVEYLEARARELGATVTSLWTGRAESPEAIPQDVMSAIDDSPCTIFNHQLGPLLRLRPARGDGVRVLNYATSWPLLESDFAHVPYGLWTAVMEGLVPEINRARRWRIQCPLGTDVSGTVPERAPGAAGGGFTLRTFPMDTHPPVPAGEMSGRIVLRWLVTSAMHDLGTEGISLDQPVTAVVTDGRIVDFVGGVGDTQAAESFLRSIGERYGKDPFRVNSWHAGVNPRTRISFRPEQSLEQWMLLAHGSPRILHFHVVGEKVPGEISATVVDATVTLDDRVAWDEGTLRLLEQDRYLDLAQRLGADHRPFEQYTQIGV